MMSDHATPNLPSRDFDATEAFYRQLGFELRWRDEGWMVLERGGLTLEFFPHQKVDPRCMWFSCCLRLDDVDSFYAACLAGGAPERETGMPRARSPVTQPWGKVGAIIDHEGNLLRLIQN